MELQRITAKDAAEDSGVGVISTPHEIAFKKGHAVITTRILDGKYPDYQRLIPDSYPNSLTVGKENLLAALRRVRLLVRDNTTPVRLSMRAGGVDLSVISHEIGDANETVDGDFSGTEIMIAFNPAYLIDGVDAVDSDEVVIETNDPSRPATVRSSDADDFRYLLMPVRVS